ncbi:MAG: hypothetical protein ACXAEN_18415 [Candidatus Thorarchaeota archaeon]
MSEYSGGLSKLLKAIHGLIDGCVKETYETQDEIPLSTLQSYFGILGSSYAHHSESDVNSSLLLRRISEWIGLTLWSQIAILSGVYESALRELRYLLEDVLVTALADKRNPTGPIGARLETVKRLENARVRGGELFKQCSEENIIQDDRIKTLLYEQYKKLCDFTHPSREVVTRSIDYSREFRFSYDSVRYGEAIELFNKTVDCLLLLVFWQMDDAAQQAFALFYRNRISRKHVFTEIWRACGPIAEKWDKAADEDLGPNLGE